MKAMVLTAIKKPLEWMEVPKPVIGPDEVLIKISACGVCRTDLHIFDGELPHPNLPLILGHQIVGRIEAVGGKVNGVKIGSRVGVPWLSGACGHCEYCLQGKENLCEHAVYTGYQVNGGFAQYCTAKLHFIFPIPSSYPDIQAAPLLCAGLIGYRAYRMTLGAKKIGFFGFGSSAHILAQVVKYKGGDVYAFTRPEDIEKQEFAKRIGAVWAGSSEEISPTPLDAAIIFAPVGSLVIHALQNIKKGGVVICAGIHMSDIPSFPYSLLWEERMIRSVANLTRKDGEELFSIAPNIPILTTVTTYPLEEANEALEDLRKGQISGSAVITVK